MRVVDCHMQEEGFSLLWSVGYFGVPLATVEHSSVDKRSRAVGHPRLMCCPKCSWFGGAVEAQEKPVNRWLFWGMAVFQLSKVPTVAASGRGNERGAGGGMGKGDRGHEDCHTRSTAASGRVRQQQGSA